MKPLPAPPVPGNTDGERISNFSQDELPKREARLKRASANERAKRGAK